MALDTDEEIVEYLKLFPPNKVRPNGDADIEAVREPKPTSAEYACMFANAQTENVRDKLYGLIGHRGGEEEISIISSSMLADIKSLNLFESGAIALQRIGGSRSVAALSALRGSVSLKENVEVEEILFSTIETILSRGTIDLVLGDNFERISGLGNHDVCFGKAAHFGTDVSSDIGEDSLFYFLDSQVKSFADAESDFKREFSQ